MHKTKATTASSAAKGTPATARPMPARAACTSRRDDHAERDATDGLRGEPDDAVAMLARKVPAEAQQSVGRALALRIHDGGNGEREQELHEQPAQASQRARHPRDRRRGVRRRRRREVAHGTGGDLLPRLHGLRPDDGQRAAATRAVAAW